MTIFGLKKKSSFLGGELVWEAQVTSLRTLPEDRGLGGACDKSLITTPSPKVDRRGPIYFRGERSK